MKFLTKSTRRTGSYAALLAMLVVWMFIFPVFYSGSGTSVLREVVFVALLLSSVGAAAGHPHETRLLVVLALTVLTGATVLHSHATTALGIPVGLEALRIVFLLLIVKVVLAHVLRTKAVTVDTILGAVCVYLMVAGIFAEAFRIVDMLDPHAIQFVEDALEGDLPAGYTNDRFVHLSVVTLTTLGLGDITPLSSVARSLVQLEAVIGQLYVALILAWLVGLHMTSRSAEDAQ